MSKRDRFDLSVYVIIDPAICGDAHIDEVTRAALDGGATFLQLRNKVDTEDIIEKQARRIMGILTDPAYANISFVIDDYVELAVKLDADGVHVGQGDMDFKAARDLIGEDKILGLTAFTHEHYEALDPGVVDYVGTGPIFPTLTKPDKAVLGIEAFTNFVKNPPVPVVGIGGITPKNAGEVIKAGAHGVAMIRAVVGDVDPKAATQDFSTVVKEARDL